MLPALAAAALVAEELSNFLQYSAAARLIRWRAPRHVGCCYCQELIRNPTDTIFVLISDLYEGGIEDEMLKRARELVDSGVTVIALLALSDSGRPSYDANHAAKLGALGVPAFACTPDLFPDMMAAAINKRDLGTWAASNNIVLASAADLGDET